MPENDSCTKITDHCRAATRIINTYIIHRFSWLVRAKAFRKLFYSKFLYRLRCAAAKYCTFSFCSTQAPFSSPREIRNRILVHHISKPWGISSYWVMLSKDSVLPVCCLVVSDVWWRRGVPPQTSGCFPRRMAEELVNWTHTTSQFPTKISTLRTGSKLLFHYAWRWFTCNISI